MIKLTHPVLPMIVLLIRVLSMMIFVVQYSHADMNVTAQGNEKASINKAFECAFTLSDGNQSIRSFTLHDEAFRCLSQKNYQDVVIVNGDNQRVPLMVRQADKTEKSIVYEVDIPFYPEPNPSAYKTQDQINRMSQLTGIVSGRESDKQWQAKNIYYSSFLLEYDPKKTLDSITLHKATSSRPVSATVIVETSQDLQHWTVLLKPYQLFFLPGQKDIFKSNVIQLNKSTQKKYLRLAVLSNINDFSNGVSRISGKYQETQSTVPKWYWRTVNAEQYVQLGAESTTDQSSSWAIHLDELLPVSKVRFSMAGDIVFYKGDIYTYPLGQSNTAKPEGKQKLKKLIKKVAKPHRRSSGEQAHTWSYLTGFNQYYLKTESGVSVSPEITFRSTQSRRWKFVFDEPKALLKHQLPTIAFAWQAPIVTFVAQGTGPFRLLAGNDSHVEPLAFPRHLLSNTSMSEPISILHSTERPLKGSAVVKQKDIRVGSNKPAEKYTMLLWLMLLGGAVCMFLMAYQLAKKMKGR